MPSHRKRIGFLPSEEVHQLIEQICINNNFSQSKVTGILVEEALRSRGVLKNFNNYIDLGKINKPQNINDKKNISKDFDLNNISNLSNLNQNTRKKDLKMINEFIEYKLFKRILNDNREIFD